MRTTEAGAQHRAWRLGFTLLELLVGLAVTMLIVASAAPLVMSLESAAFRETDRTIAVLQARVAVARLERDLRMASVGDSSFAIEAPILEANPREVVFLGRVDGYSQACVLEWEIAASTLMRRWGPCPGARPASFDHALYSDNKSMLAGLGGESSFAYIVGDEVVNTVSADELCLIRAVVLDAWGLDMVGQWRSLGSVEAPVGR